MNLYSQPGGGAYGGYVGSVFYAHVEYPIGDGAYNTNNGPIAYLPYRDCACGCYMGAHSHIEQYAGNVYSGVGWGNNSGCHTSAHEGTTPVFYWDA